MFPRGTLQIPSAWRYHSYASLQYLANIFSTRDSPHHLIEYLSPNELYVAIDTN